MVPYFLGCHVTPWFAIATVTKVLDRFTTIPLVVFYPLKALITLTPILNLIILKLDQPATTSSLDFPVSTLVAISSDLYLLSSIE